MAKEVIFTDGYNNRAHAKIIQDSELSASSRSRREGTIMQDGKQYTIYANMTNGFYSPNGYVAVEKPKGKAIKIK